MDVLRALNGYEYIRLKPQPTSITVACNENTITALHHVGGYGPCWSCLLRITHPHMDCRRTGGRSEGLRARIKKRGAGRFNGLGAIVDQNISISLLFFARHLPNSYIGQSFGLRDISCTRFDFVVISSSFPLPSSLPSSSLLPKRPLLLISTWYVHNTYFLHQFNRPL